MRDVYPVKYYKDEGFVEYKIEIDEEDLEEIIEDYLMRHAEFDFDEIEIVNNRPITFGSTPNAASTWTPMRRRKSR
jgi:hypothetical protein